MDSESLLTPLEISILRYFIEEGGTIEDAPGALSLHVRAFNAYLESAYAKLGARSVNNAAAQLGKRNLFIWPAGKKRRVVLSVRRHVDILICIANGQSIDEIKCKEFPASQVDAALRELWDVFAINLGQRRTNARLVYLACYHDICVARDSLTMRQRQIMQLRASGYNGSMVAQMLGISEGTVRQHSNRILSKYGASRFAEAIMSIPAPENIDWLSQVT